MNIDGLLNSDLKTKCVAFFNITSQCSNGDFIIKSEYRESKFTNMVLDSHTTLINNDLLNQQTSLNFDIIRDGYHQAIVENDIGVSLGELLNKLYTRIEMHRNETNFKQDVLLSCFALRGSYDPTGGFYTVDLYDLDGMLDEEDYRIQILNLIGDRNINAERGSRNQQIRIQLIDFLSELQLMQYWNIYKYSKHQYL